MIDSPHPEGEYEYIGNELELFQLADNWKRYLAERMKPYVSGHVLEVGAGFGANVPYLYREDLEEFVSLEPDSHLCSSYRERQQAGLIPSRCELVEGMLQKLEERQRFDTILYVDVLEHIEEDASEVERAFSRLRPGGHLVVLCPAHQWLYSPFDKAIGHFRRYNKSMYRKLSSRQPVHVEYLDSAGLLASLANKMFLKQSYPTEKQVRFWDRRLVTLSKRLDPLTLHLLGKSLLGIWRH
jgi:SAM-dependent methyltransferase